MPPVLNAARNTDYNKREAGAGVAIRNGAQSDLVPRNHQWKQDVPAGLAPNSRSPKHSNTLKTMDYSEKGRKS